MVILHRNGIGVQTIAWRLECHTSTVYRWIGRVEKGETLEDKKRCGRPPIFSESHRLRIIAFYCQTPPPPGCNRWSLRWAATYLQGNREIIQQSISHSTIHRILKGHALRPHLHKYFLAITDPDFFPKAEHLIELYKNPPQYLFSYDECTGIKAWAPLSPTLPATAQQPQTEEFDYKRNGTVDLMAFLDVRKGTVFGKCDSNHKTETVVAFLEQHVATLPPDSVIHYVMDNLCTHCNDIFCHAVARLSGVEYKPLKTAAERREWLAGEQKRIIIHFTPFHGSWLNMIEIWFGILKERCLNKQSFHSVDYLKEVIEAFINTWNNFFAHPFKWKYEGKDLHKTAISRFNKLLEIESKQMEIKFLTKQLLLMANIINLFYKEGPDSLLTKLHELMKAKATYIENIIDGDTKKKPIQWAKEALERFTTTIAGCISKT